LIATARLGQGDRRPESAPPVPSPQEIRMSTNRLKSRLASGRKCLGVWTAGVSTIYSETLAAAGYDFLFIDHEHGPQGLMETIPHLQTLAATECPPVIRVPWNDAVYLKRLLDIGAESVMLPMIETAEQAKAAVAACRYPPRGFRGFGPLRALGTEPDIDAYGRTAHERLLLIAQIESEKAVANVDAIAAVEGIDALYIGPNDLSGTLGHFREWEHPSLQKAIDAAFAGIRRAGKPAGIVPYGRNTIASLFADGYSIIAASTELTLLRNGARAEVEAHRKQFG
jgi:4-hydroxy-2-oxoheptanedioate aldolase